MKLLDNCRCPNGVISTMGKLVIVASGIILHLFYSYSAFAHNKVVVIPLAGEDIPVMPTPFNPLTKQSPPDSDYEIGPNIVLDKITGLQWQRDSSDTGLDFSLAWIYCSSLTLDSIGDWRLPLLDELLSLVDFEASVGGAAINTTAFPNTELDYYWSSSNALFNGVSSMAIFFKFGDVIPILRSSTTPYVRCVR